MQTDAGVQEMRLITLHLDDSPEPVAAVALIFKDMEAAAAFYTTMGMSGQVDAAMPDLEMPPK